MSAPRIMVVEDEWVIANDIKMSLEGFGYEVCSVVSSGEDAVKTAKEKRPDLTLMDIVLPGEIDGIEAATRIGKEHNIPVIYLTAYADDKILSKMKLTGPQAYLVKPFKDRELRAAIELALYRHGIERELEKHRLHLEELVEERTSELTRANQNLKHEIAERERLGLEIEASLREKETLIEEINHRVNNNMQVIYGLLDLQSRQVKEKKILDI